MFRASGGQMTAKVYAARASQDVVRGQFEEVEARMQGMERDGFEIDEELEDRAIEMLQLQLVTIPKSQEKAEEILTKNYNGI